MEVQQKIDILIKRYNTRMEKIFQMLNFDDVENILNNQDLLTKLDKLIEDITKLCTKYQVHKCQKIVGKLYNFFELLEQHKELSDYLTNKILINIYHYVVRNTDLPAWYVRSSILCITHFVEITDWTVNTLFRRIWKQTKYNNQKMFLKCFVECLDQDKIIEYSSKLNKELQKDFLDLLSNSDTDVAIRTFLNHINSEEDPPKIVSAIAKEIRLCDTHLTNNEWFDFNILENTFTFECPLNCLTLENSGQDYVNLDTVTIKTRNIHKIEIKYVSEDSYILTLNLSKPAFAFYETSIEFLRDFNVFQFFVQESKQRVKECIFDYWKSDIKETTPGNFEIILLENGQDSPVSPLSIQEESISEEDSIIEEEVPPLSIECAGYKRTSLEITVPESQNSNSDESQSSQNIKTLECNINSSLLEPRSGNESVAETISLPSEDSGIFSKKNPEIIDLSNSIEVPEDVEDLLPNRAVTEIEAGNEVEIPNRMRFTTVNMNQLPSPAENEIGDVILQTPTISPISISSKLKSSGSNKNIVDVEDLVPNRAVIEIEVENEVDIPNLTIFNTVNMNQLLSPAENQIGDVMTPQTPTINLISLSMTQESTGSKKGKKAKNILKSPKSPKSPKRKYKKRELEIIDFEDRSFFSDAETSLKITQTRTRIIKKVIPYQVDTETTLKRRKRQAAQNDDPPAKRIKTILPVRRQSENCEEIALDAETNKNINPLFNTPKKFRRLTNISNFDHLENLDEDPAFSITIPELAPSPKKNKDKSPPPKKNLQDKSSPKQDIQKMDRFDKMKLNIPFSQKSVASKRPLDFFGSSSSQNSDGQLMPKKVCLEPVNPQEIFESQPGPSGLQEIKETASKKAKASLTVNKVKRTPVKKVKKVPAKKGKKTKEVPVSVEIFQDSNNNNHNNSHNNSPNNSRNNSPNNSLNITTEEEYGEYNQDMMRTIMQLCKVHLKKCNINERVKFCQGMESFFNKIKNRDINTILF